MEENDLQPSWIAEYDYPSRQVCVTLAESGPVGHHWTGIRKDDVTSDPNGAFDIYVADNNGLPEGLTALTTIVKVVAGLDDEGDFKNPHADFDTLAIGSPTIWPYKVAGERLGLAHWMWWAAGPIFRQQPRSWSEAARPK